MECTHNYDFVKRHRINEGGTGFLYHYFHCQLCDKNIFISGDKEKFDKDNPAEAK